MAYKINKTKEFLKNVVAILEYLEKEWGMRSAQKFQTILDSKLEMLSNDLISGAETVKNKEIRKLSITTHNKIYYKIVKEEIIILSLFENKMNPKRNPYE
jgi:plasmid stabilization system protein ParE